MQINPRSATIATAITGIVLTIISILTLRSEAALAGGALLIAVAWGRASTRVDVALARHAGFEMIWKIPRRKIRMATGETQSLVAEIRNRSSRIIHVSDIHAIASEALQVEVLPIELDVLPHHVAHLNVQVTALRVGRHGLHGFILGAGGVSAAYEIPLTFANPIGIEVVPKSVVSGLTSPRGGRLRANPSMGRPRIRRGEGTELREIREWIPGDPFRTIAWKASARVGHLMVREMQSDERDVLWIVLDVSPEGWLGRVGHAPLDRALEIASSFAIEQSRKGTLVGIALTTDRVVAWSPPAHGGVEIEHLANIWLEASEHCHEHRLGLEIDDLLRLVVAHAHPLDSAGLSNLLHGDMNRLFARLEGLRTRAPFQHVAYETTPLQHNRDQIVRNYAASFGLDVPARSVGPNSVLGLAAALQKITRVRPKLTNVVIVAPIPQELTHTRNAIEEALVSLRKSRAKIHWAVVDRTLGLSSSSSTEIFSHAILLEQREKDNARIKELKKLGVRVISPRSLSTY